jgi:site-specific recombinase XerD
MHDSKLTLDGVTLQALEDWQKWMFVARHYGEQFRKQHIAALRQFFAWRDRFLNKPNPSKFMRGPKVTKKTPRKFNTQDLQRLFATCDKSTTLGARDYAMLLFFYATGARKEEAQQLDIGQLTLRDRTGKVRFIGKGAKEREVTFQGEAVDAMRRWLSLRDTMTLANKNAVWIGVCGQTQYGDRITGGAIEHMLKRRIKLAGINAKGLHSLRVTFATDLYDEGVDIAIIQQLLGHEKIETTRRYIIVSDRKLNTKMPTSRINIITGRANHELPRWAQKKQQQQRPVQSDD